MDIAIAKAGYTGKVESLSTESNLVSYNIWLISFYSYRL